jgi:hypothetical protein
MNIAPKIPAGTESEIRIDRAMARAHTVTVLMIFAFLQVLDIATTVLTLKMGGVEKNQLIQQFMSIGPITGLIVSKLMVVLFAGGCALLGKPRPVLYANLVFAGIVVWNLSVIIRLLG